MRDELQAACLGDGIELFEAIGQGGNATVWRGRWHERDVAIKVVAGREIDRDRLMREARAAGPTLARFSTRTPASRPAVEAGDPGSTEASVGWFCSGVSTMA